MLMIRWQSAVGDAFEAARCNGRWSGTRQLLLGGLVERLDRSSSYGTSWARRRPVQFEGKISVFTSETALGRARVLPFFTSEGISREMEMFSTITRRRKLRHT